METVHISHTLEHSTPFHCANITPLDSTHLSCGECVVLCSDEEDASSSLSPLKMKEGGSSSSLLLDLQRKRTLSSMHNAKVSSCCTASLYDVALFSVIVHEKEWTIMHINYLYLLILNYMRRSTDMFMYA